MPAPTASADEVDRILRGASAFAEAEAFFYQNEPQAHVLTEQIQALAQQPDERWDDLCLTFNLSDPERQMLALALSLEVDPSLTRVFAYLGDTHPSLYLAAHLFQWTPGMTLTAESALVRWLLAAPQTWSLSAEWYADPYLVRWLTGTELLDPNLDGAVWIDHHSLPDLCLYPLQLAEMQDFAAAAEPMRGQIALVGGARLRQTNAGRAV